MSATLPRFECCQCEHMTQKSVCRMCDHRLCAECKPVSLHRRVRARPKTIVLSRRELEIVTRFAQGMRLTEIADAIFLSKKTVSEFRARCIDKLGLPQGSNDVALVLAAWRRGDIELSREVPK